MKKVIITLLALSVSITTLTTFAKQNQCGQDSLARRGCCSWHDCVCGCAGGRVQCCDGTQSPSCGCKKDEFKNEEMHEKMLNGKNINGIKS